MGHDGTIVLSAFSLSYNARNMSSQSFGVCNMFVSLVMVFLVFSSTPFVLVTVTPFQPPIIMMRRASGRHGHTSTCTTSTSSNTRTRQSLSSWLPTDHNNDSSLTAEDAFDLVRFQRRQRHLEQQRQIQRQRQKQPLPPHASLSPQQVVSSVLHELQFAAPYFCYYENDRYKPRPHPGVQTLWQASTAQWQKTMATMVGMADDLHVLDDQENDRDRDRDDVVMALGRFLARPKQQFAILLRSSAGSNSSSLETKSQDDDVREFCIDFPTDVVEWSDDEAWLECRLRCRQTNDLLIVLGWTLHKQPLYKNSNSYSYSYSNDDQQQQHEQAWYIHAMDWQDFRNDYRPGIGREEWERICG